jgi:hypothetical protein
MEMKQSTDFEEGFHGRILVSLSTLFYSDRLLRPATYWSSSSPSLTGIVLFRQEASVKVDAILLSLLISLHSVFCSMTVGTRDLN